jgi:hypothetical protein
MKAARFERLLHLDPGGAQSFDGHDRRRQQVVVLRADD